MLEIEEIACGYGKIEALRKVSLSAKPNEVTCLLGPNGAGKTTLMMSLAGILKPSHGSIKFEGQNLVGLTPSQIVQRGLALVPENRLVFPALTVRENLMAGAYLRKDLDCVNALTNWRVLCRAASNKCWLWVARSCRALAFC